MVAFVTRNLSASGQGLSRYKNPWQNVWSFGIMQHDYWLCPRIDKRPEPERSEWVCQFSSPILPVSNL
jgi:hypothetical protein